MRIDTLAQKELVFDQTLVDNKGRHFTLVATEDIGDVTLKRLVAPATGYYYKEKSTKTMIVVHSTIGVLSGDVSTLTTDGNPVSVSYLIGRNGVVYELFSPDYWAYHLGQGSISGNKVNSMRSIGIEMCNLGPLHNFNGNLETIYSRQSITGSDGKPKLTAQDIYCTVDHTNEYVKLDSPFRGETYFCAYTPAQYKALNKLVRYLCDRFNIPMNICESSTVFGESQAKTFSGICSHVNYRPSGKWDVGPDFNWAAIRNDIVITAAPQTKTADTVKQATPVILTPSTGLPPFLPTQTQQTPQSTTVKSLFSGFLSRWIK